MAKLPTPTGVGASSGSASTSAYPSAASNNPQQQSQSITVIPSTTLDGYRDVCLRAALHSWTVSKEDREIFSRIWDWVRLFSITIETEEGQKKERFEEGGSLMAWTLLLMRLYRAFESRRLTPKSNTGSTAAAVAASERKTVPAASSNRSMTVMGARNVAATNAPGALGRNSASAGSAGGTAAQQNKASTAASAKSNPKIAAPPFMNMPFYQDVNAYVVESLQLIVTDLVQARKRLPEQFQDWSVAEVCHTALKLFSKGAPPDNKTDGGSSGKTGGSKIDNAETGETSTAGSKKSETNEPPKDQNQNSSGVDLGAVAARSLYQRVKGNIPETATITPAVTRAEEGYFRTFLCKTLELITCRTIETVEAYQDFMFIWDHLQLSDFWEDLVIGGLELEPPIPGVPQPGEVTLPGNNTSPATAGARHGEVSDNAETKAAATTEKQETSPGETAEKTKHSSPSSLNVDDEEASPAYKAHTQKDRIRRIAWGLSCFLSGKFLLVRSYQLPSRRQRLLASCAALGLLAALPVQNYRRRDDAMKGSGDVKNGPHSPKRRRIEEDDRQTDKPLTKLTIDDRRANEATKKAGKPSLSLADMLQIVLDSANKEAAFTRWACFDGGWKIPCDLSNDELSNEMLHLASELAKRLDFEFSKPSPKVSKYEGSAAATGPCARLIPKEGLPAWINNLLVTIRSPGVLTWYLPTLAERMYSSMRLALGWKTLPVQAVPFLDETCIAQTDTIDPFCNKHITCPPSLFERDEPVVVAGIQGDKSSEAPARIEKEVMSLSSAGKGSGARAVLLPPIITEAMELNEWTVSLLFLEVVKPSRNLRNYLEASSSSEQAERTWQSVIVPTLNRTLLRFSQENIADKPTRIAPVSVDNETGQVLVFGELTQDKQMCKAVVALYYHALEAIIYCETARLSPLPLGKSPRKEEFSHPALVLNEVFHCALLACCSSSVIKAVGATQKLRPSPSLQTLQIFSILHVAESSPYDYLKVSESYHRALTLDTARGKLGSPLIFALPRILQREVKQTDVQITDSLVWSRDVKFSQSLPDKIEEFESKSSEGESDSDGGPQGSVSLWPPQVLAPTLNEEIEDLGGVLPKQKYPTRQHPCYAEYRAVSHIVRKLLKTCYIRIQELCKLLDVPPQLPLVSQVWVAFRYLLRNRIDLVFERHIDHWLLCSLYGTSKIMKHKPEITFARIIDAYVSLRGQELGDVTCQRIVRHIKVSPKNDVGNIISLYNRLYVPAMKDHLLKSKSLRRCAAEVAQLASAGRLYYANRSSQAQLGAVVPDVRLITQGTKTSATPRGHPIKDVGGADAASGKTRTIIQFGDAHTTKMVSQANEITSSQTVSRGAASGSETAVTRDEVSDAELRVNPTSVVEATTANAAKTDTNRTDPGPPKVASGGGAAMQPTKK